MRRNAISSAVQEEEAEINMTPMLDVVFIMLIFFIVTANFIKEPDNPQGSVVIQADEKAMADTIIKVMDGSREAGVYNISLASEPK